VSDGFTGRAPDLGAIELGSADGPYGPGSGARPGNGGTSGTGGSAGSSTTGGATTGGSTTGGSMTGGTTGGAGGSDATGGTSAPGGSDPATSEDGGCGCRVVPTTRGAPSLLLLVAFAFLGRRSRRARVRGSSMGGVVPSLRS